MVNKNSLANLSRLGRKPLFTEVKAQEILKARRNAFPERMTIERFGQILLENGIIDKPVACITLRRLLSGSLYPDLIDPEAPGYAYPFKTLPSLVRGRPGKRAQAIDYETGLPRKYISKAKEEFKVAILAEARIDSQASMLYVTNRVRELIDTDITYIKERLNAAEKEIAELKNRITHA